MKTQTFGWGGVLRMPFLGKVTVSRAAFTLMRAAREAVTNYREQRQNGLDEDAPARPFPGDGKKSDWIKCPDEHALPTPRKSSFFRRGGFKEGWQGDGFYRIRYDEGPGDRAWMDERDRNYLTRMEKEKAQADESVEMAAALAAKIHSISEEAAKLSHGGQYLEAIKLCDLGLAENANHLGLRQQRASYHEALFQQAKSPKHQQLYIEKAIEDYQYCVRVDEYDETFAIKVNQLTALLAGLSASPPGAVSSDAVLSPADDGHASLESYTEVRRAIKACDEAIASNSGDIAAHKTRAGHFMTLFRSAQTEKFKQRFLERAKADYTFCVDKDDCDEASSLKVEEIEALLAQLAGACLSSAGSGAGAGAASPPPMPSPSFSRTTPTSPSAGGELPRIAYSELTATEKLGEGGFGVVYKGRWKFVDVAVKRFKLGPGLTEEAMADLIAEAQRLYSLRHPNIVQLLAICTEPDNTCMVLEFMVNGSLFHLLRREKNLDWKTRYKLAFGVAAGLAFLHSRRVIHRDLKTLNVLLDDKWQAKLADFGLSMVKSETASSMQLAGGMVGTPAWMAPESLDDEPKIGEKSDVYTLGVLLWAIAACREPYAKAPNVFVIMRKIIGGVQEEIPADTPSSYASIIRQCWAMESSARPTAETVAHALEVMANAPAVGAGVGPTSPASPPHVPGPSYREMSGMSGSGGDTEATGPGYRNITPG